MTTIAPPRPAELPGLPVRLTAGPATVAEARRQVRAALDLWRAPVDPDVAVLLTSDLVTNAIRHQPGGTITLGVRCVAGQLRVDVHGSAIGPDLILVQTPVRRLGLLPHPRGPGGVLHARVPARRPGRVTMTIHAPSDTTSFDACLRLFERYPLAVTRHCADGGYLSMVLLNRAAGQAGFFVLTQARDDLFVIRSWNRHDGVDQGIRPGEPVGGPIHQLITGSMPVPRDGALLGWVTHRQVTVMLAVYARQQEPWDAPVPVPDIRVMPMAGTTELLHWPPFTASPLDDGRLWEYVEWGEIADIGLLVARGEGRAFWVPAPDRRSARHGCVVITDNLVADEYWLPAGVYVDHWTLREGLQAPPASELLALPGVTDLARRLR